MIEVDWLSTGNSTPLSGSESDYPVIRISLDSIGEMRKKNQFSS
jgi:hypothetical protein